jgi:pantetheine-phosphate adenylyltransferase
MARIAVYPGSFDPCTNGHIDIITRAAKVFDKVIVAVLKNSEKMNSFSAEQRVNLLKKATARIDNVEIDSFDGLLVDYVRKIDANVIIKGLRALSDFEYEFSMALTNKKLDAEIETVFLVASDNNMYLSSSVVREMARYGANLKDFVPAEISEEISNRFFRRS